MLYLFPYFQHYKAMKKLLFFLIATSLTIAANAQDPMNVNPFSDATVTIGGSGVPTTNGMVSKSKISSDPLYYCIVDDAKRLAVVTSKVRNAELKDVLSSLRPSRFRERHTRSSTSAKMPLTAAPKSPRSKSGATLSRNFVTNVSRGAQV